MATRMSPASPKGADGLWHGTAMRGNTQVQVTVDRAGKVAAQ